MKKAYEAPKVEKMVFDYSDAVVASNTSLCHDVVTSTDVARIGEPKCTTTPVYSTTNNLAT